MCFLHTVISLVSLIAGLEYGLEQWNGLLNGLWIFVHSRWNYFTLCSSPFPLCQTSEESPSLLVRLQAMYTTGLLTLIKYAHNL